MTDREKNGFLGDPDQDENKTELANRIAEQSKRVASTYQMVEDWMLRIIRWFSSILDKFLFNNKHPVFVSLFLAVLFYVSVNYNTLSSVYTSPLRATRSLDDMPIIAKYNTDTFELSGMPQTVDVNVVGDATSVNNAVAAGGTIVLDLEGYTEGRHEVKFTFEGYGSNVDVITEPSTVIVTLKKKTTQQFDLTYDFINQNAMDNIYSVGVPEFEYAKVNVRASRDTLDSIAFVKALIDVSGQTADFEQDARLIAYNSSGVPVTADIIPNTVHVSVPVTSPSKTVPIEVQVNGEVSGDMAIELISTDQQTVTIYGPNTVLSNIDKVVVTLNADTIAKNSTILRPISLPAGINSSNINQITITITLAEKTSKVVDDVRIMYRNNTNNYKFTPVVDKTTTSVTVSGTAANIENVTADNINVYVDMTDAKPGVQAFDMQVEQPSNGLVKYTLNEATYQMNVLGETNEEANDDGLGGTNDG